MKRAYAIVTAAVLLVCATACLAAVSTEKITDRATADWTNLNYVAEGRGAMPSLKDESNRAVALLKAKDYAIMDALRHLLMAIEGTKITFNSIGSDYMADTTIRQEIQGFVNGARVTRTREEKVEGDTIIVVEVSAPMFRNGGPGTIFTREQARVDAAATVPQAAVTVVAKPDKAATARAVGGAVPSTPDKPYTGLIVDATGYSISRCMSPKIRRTDGQEVWGTVNASWDEVQDRGIVAYAESLKAARKNPRVGTHPLVLSAVGRAGGRFYSDVVISDYDADLLLAENAKSGFLDKFSVIFVKDPAL